MAALPSVRPISDLRLRQAEVLEETRQGPVILAHRGRAAAVLVSLERWNSLVGELEDLRDVVEVLEAKQRVAAGEERLISLEELEAELAGDAVSA
jgi:prevent-host-death family protein